jgi:hypothetical protein
MPPDRVTPRAMAGRPPLIDRGLGDAQQARKVINRQELLSGAGVVSTLGEGG